VVKVRVVVRVRPSEIIEVAKREIRIAKSEEIPIIKTVLTATSCVK